MKIQLDTSALEALFPEGTEARLDLQQAVLQNIVNRNFIKMSTDEVKNRCYQAARSIELPDLNDMIQKNLKQLFENYGYGRMSNATERLQEDVKQKVQNIASEKLGQLITQSVDKATEGLYEKVKRQTAYYVDSIMARADDDAVKHLAKIMNERFDDVIKAAIAQRMGL